MDVSYPVGHEDPDPGIVHASFLERCSTPGHLRPMVRVPCRIQGHGGKVIPEKILVGLSFAKF